MRGVHWCNKKIETIIEVLIIHSTHFPSKRTYVDGPRARGGGEIENSKSLVWHVHTQRTRRMARTAKSLHGRPAHAGVQRYERLSERATTPSFAPPSRPLSLCTSHCPCHTGLDAVQCDAVWRRGSGLGSSRSGWRRPRRTADMVMVVAPSADQMNACVSKGHTQAVST